MTIEGTRGGSLVAVLGLVLAAPAPLAAQPDDDDSTDGDAGDGMGPVDDGGDADDDTYRDDGREPAEDSTRVDDDGTGWGDPDRERAMLGDPIADPDREVRAAAVRPPDPRWPDGRTSIGLVGGLAPSGLVGLEIGRDVTRGVSIALAGGWNLPGPQFAFTARKVAFRPQDGLAFVVGGGASFGDAEDRTEADVGGDYVARLDGALWLNAEAGLELRSLGGWYGRAAAGFGVVLTTLDCSYDREATRGLSTGNPASSAPCNNRQEHLLSPALSLTVGRGF